MYLEDKYFYISNGEKLFKNWRTRLKKKSAENVGDLDKRDVIAYLEDRDERIENLEKKVKEYQEFFSTMKRLLPRDFSVHDIIN